MAGGATLVKISEVRVTGLRVPPTEGTWLADIGAREDVDTLLEVVTDEDLVDRAAMARHAI